MMACNCPALHWENIVLEGRRLEEIFKHKNRIVMFAVTFLEYTLTLNILSI